MFGELQCRINLIATSLSLEVHDQASIAHCRYSVHSVNNQL
jgi:hypothetical protein